ncbi:MAG: hypothetical protein WBB37_09170 [bacterium]
MKNKYNINLHDLSPIDMVIGDNQEDKRLLKEFRSEAESFLRNKKWCQKIKNGYWGFGIGGIIGIFLFEILPISKDIDEYIWIVVGDLPSAYISPVYCKNVKEVLEGYIFEMRKWISAVHNNDDIDKLIPVNTKPTMENANSLELRLQFLEDKILPTL